jgi:drug/metabolite transporter (DMT)-like permease
VFAYNLFFFAGLKQVPAGRASLIIACNPAFIALAAAWFFRERLKLVNVLGIGLSITGAVIVISQGDPAALLTGRVGLGELYIFGCVLSWVLYSIIGKAAMKRLTPLTAVTFSCAIGAACLLPPACHNGLLQDFSRYSTAAWAGIVYLGFFGSALGFCWYYEGIKAIGPSRAGVFINFVPLSGVILAHLLLQEPITAVIVVGAVFVVTGVYCTNRSR